MPEPAVPHLKNSFHYLGAACCGVLSLMLLLPACQSGPGKTAAATTPPVGHYEGSIERTGQATVRAALDIRHPRMGHYEAELTAAGASTLGFVADTIIFSNDTLRLTRPAHANQVLTLALEGDFLRGTLALGSSRVPVLLVKRGNPTPSTYRVEELPQAAGSAWLFAPADTSTPGPALALLPDAETMASAAVWADALAREGIIVLLLPAVDPLTVPAETARLRQALKLVRGTAGAAPAAIGAWAVGTRASALAHLLADDADLRVNFLIAQNAPVASPDLAAWRELRKRRLPVLGLYGGPTASRQATTLRRALGSRRSNTVHAFRTTRPNLAATGGLSPQSETELPTTVVEWLRNR